jgi:phenylacetate-CoA ligase
LILECSGPEVYDEPGELLITHLYNYAMPLIRYQVDDQAVLEPGPCGCGRTTPRLARVVGRKMPPFINPAGAAVEPYFLISRVRAMDNVVEFQLIQHDRYHLQLLVVAGQGCTHDQFAEARDVIARYMGAECELRIDFVDSLPRPDSGKLQMLVSHLAAEG